MNHPTPSFIALPSESRRAGAVGCDREAPAVVPAGRGRRLAVLFGLLPVLACVPSGRADSNADAAIRRIRMGTLIVQTTPGAAVEIEQTRHAFWFGAALASQAFDGGMSASDTARYRETFLANFNAAVPENALKWLSMEPEPGAVNYATIDAILDWADRHHLPVRGHNVYWGIKKYVPAWQQTMDDPTLLRTLEARGRDIGSRYRGRFTEYDLNNEMIHGNYYADRFGPGITLKMAQWIRQEDPAARLFVNDYDILTDRRLDDYVAHIRRLLQMDVPVAGIGVQGHLHGETFDPAKLRHALDVLARFNLPIRVTEFNLPGQRSKFHEHPDLAITPEEEEANARDIAAYYRICFSHPAVTGILMWGFWGGANWIPASSLYRRDWSPTPAATAYHDLVYKEWWTHWKGQAGPDGRCEIPAFFGSYRITAGGKQAAAELGKQAGTLTVKLP
jgi:GH35 family endo-1,4-beta-xylanase